MADDVSRDRPARLDPPRWLGAQSWDELSLREQRIAEAAQIVNTLLQAAPVGFGFVDRDMRFQRVNSELARIAGRPMEAMRGHPVTDIAPAGGVVTNAMRDVLESGVPVVDLAVSNGGRHFMLSLFPVDSVKGERAGLGILAHDVTDRTRLIQRLQALAEAAVGISSLSVDEVRTLVADKVAAILGANGVEVAMALDPTALDADDQWLVAPLVARDGGRIGLIRVTRRHDDDAFDEADEATLVQLARFASIAIENARLHRETEHAERRYRSLVESSSVLVFVTDAAGSPHGELPTWEEFTGQAWPEYRGRGWLERYHPDDRGRVGSVWDRAVETGQFFSTPARLWHARTGAFRHIWLQAAPVLDLNGTIVEWMGTATDVEDGVQAQRLEEAQRIARVGSFAIDLATGWVTASRELNRIAGIPLDSAGMTVDEALALIVSEDRDDVAHALAALTEGKPTTFDGARLMRPDGTLRVIVASGEPLFDSEGSVIAVHGTLRDVTEERAVAALERERRVVMALQDALLPEHLPAVEGVDIAVRYLAASDAAVGGDWYDAFSLADGTIALAIGDVTGHGVASAAVMSQVRSALRAYMMEGHQPAHVLTLLDNLVGALVPDTFVTAIVAVYDPARGDLRIARAGHPLPLLRTATDVCEINVPGGPPLGTGYGHLQLESTIALPVGGDFVLFTDGLVERRGAAIDEGVARARHALLEGDTSSADAVCSTLVGACVEDRAADDVCILAIRRIGS